ncbi:MAG: Ppx/GppA family phosphatase, partial [Pseudobdellovibrionaceae bacterium]
MRIAAMDLGTNTFLCLVAEKDFSGQPAVIWDGVEIVRLGQGIDQTGLLHPDALARGRTCLEQFKQKCLEFKVDKIMALATSAARDAKNKDQFLEILSDLQIPLKIISGSEEAHYTYHGGLFGFAEDVLNKHDENIVIDIGGGSTEIILGHHKNILWAESLNIGGVRLTEKFISQQPVSAEDWSKAQQ